MSNSTTTPITAEIGYQGTPTITINRVAYHLAGHSMSAVRMLQKAMHSDKPVRSTDWQNLPDLRISGAGDEADNAVTISWGHFHKATICQEDAAELIGSLLELEDALYARRIQNAAR